MLHGELDLPLESSLRCNDELSFLRLLFLQLWLLLVRHSLQLDVAHRQLSHLLLMLKLLKCSMSAIMKTCLPKDLELKLIMNL